nr:PREDICTED: ketimine reductase mu-crystallin [Lepisosteus oculatus]
MSGLPVLIGGSEVDELLRYQDLVPRLEAALGQFSSRTGEVVQPVRTILPLEKYSGYLGVMPAYIPQDDVLATKMVSFYQRGEGSSMPNHQATVLLLDPERGALQAVLDGKAITDKRTAAVSAIATKLLKPARADVLCLLGAGDQALSHYEALTQMFPFKEVRRDGRRAARTSAVAPGPGASALTLPGCQSPTAERPQSLLAREGTPSRLPRTRS